MFTVCQGCGMHDGDRPVVEGRVACTCGHLEPVAIRPLFLVCGPSATGKSTLAHLLPRVLPEVVTLDTDILWSAAMDTPEDGYLGSRATWLRMAVNLHQNGRPALLLGAFTADRFEGVPGRNQVGPLHTLVLTCSDDVLEARLRGRPAWRGVDDGFVESMLLWNRQLRSDDRYRGLDTSTATPEVTAGEVAAWVRAGLAATSTPT